MEQIFYKSGALYLRRSEAKREYFYEDGRLKTVEPYREGRLDGEVQLFWPNGKLKRRVHFSKGIRQGNDEMWDEEGTLIDRAVYEFGSSL